MIGLFLTLKIPCLNSKMPGGWGSNLALHCLGGCRQKSWCPAGYPLGHRTRGAKRMSALQGSNPVPWLCFGKRPVLQFLSRCFSPPTISHPHGLATFVAELSPVGALTLVTLTQMEKSAGPPFSAWLTLLFHFLVGMSNPDLVAKIFSCNVNKKKEIENLCLGLQIA